MLRVTIHSGLPSEACRFNRTDWLDIGYQRLGTSADYKVALVENGKGARQPVILAGYPRWSSSLWDLTARAIAISLWTTPPAHDIRQGFEPAAFDSDGESIRIDDVTPVDPAPSRQLRTTDAKEVEVQPADIVGRRCAFATHTTALITHLPSRGVGGRRLGTMLIAHHRKKRGVYGISIEEDTRTRKIEKPFFFMPPFLRPAELVLRAALNMLTGDINRLPPCPEYQVPRTDIIGGVVYLPIHRLEEPTRTGFLRWLHFTDQAPKPARNASLGRVPVDLYIEFLKTAV